MEGVIPMDNAAQMRTVMMTELRRIGEGTADAWERAVFEHLTGGAREDVDWDVEDNHAGYATWVRSFDQFAQALVADGFVTVTDAGGTLVFRPTALLAAADGPRLVHVPRN
jgi:hypothetical protein